METREDLKLLKENVEKVIVGKSEIIDLLLTAVLAKGHVLIEDLPGTGKTILAKTLAKSIRADFSRIQFTPDLLPSDVLGVSIFNRKNDTFEFRQGPVFCNILLADEINRATPRTQSALLECMEENQVTVDGSTRILKDPFLVIATQNPIETVGTFPLPEAQLDRFMMRLSMGELSPKEEMDLLLRFEKENPFETLKPVWNCESIPAMRLKAEQTFIQEELLAYLQNICVSTRSARDVMCGASPRAMLSYLKAVKAYAYIKGRDYVVPEDIKVLAIPVLSHRLVMQGGFNDEKSAKETISRIIQVTSVPTEEWEKR